MTAPSQPSPTASSGSGIALTSLIAGLVSIVLLLVFFFSMVGPALAWGALVVGLLGMILGIVALKKRQSKGMAVTGLVISIVTIVVTVALFIFALIFVGAFLL